MDFPYFLVIKVINLKNSNEQQFYYFANGHLTKDKYAFKTIKKDGKIAGEIVRASDANVWSGIATGLVKPVQIKNGNRFTMDVLMDYLGPFSFKLEDSKDGGSNSTISVKNTRINEWETLVFDFSNAIFGSPSYNKITLFFKK